MPMTIIITTNTYGDQKLAYESSDKRLIVLTPDAIIFVEQNIISNPQIVRMKLNTPHIMVMAMAMASCLVVVLLLTPGVAAQNGIPRHNRNVDKELEVIQPLLSSDDNYRIRRADSRALKVKVKVKGKDNSAVPSTVCDCVALIDLATAATQDKIDLLSTELKQLITGLKTQFATIEKVQKDSYGLLLENPPPTSEDLKKLKEHIDTVQTDTQKVMMAATDALHAEMTSIGNKVLVLEKSSSDASQLKEKLGTVFDQMAQTQKAQQMLQENLQALTLYQHDDTFWTPVDLRLEPTDHHALYQPLVEFGVPSNTGLISARQVFVLIQWSLFGSTDSLPGDVTGEVKVGTNINIDAVIWTQHEGGRQFKTYVRGSMSTTNQGLSFSDSATVWLPFAETTGKIYYENQGLKNFKGMKSYVDITLTIIGYK